MNKTFRGEVLSAFAPVLNNFSYSITGDDDYSVVLKSIRMIIQVQYDWRQSFEIAISFREMNGSSEVPFNLGEVFRVSNVPNSSSRWFCQTSDLETISAFLESTCSTLMEYCQPILCGDPAALRMLHDLRNREAADYTLEVQLAAIRNRAEIAWRNKEYQKYLDLLGGFEQVLPPTDQAKLQYASEKISKQA